MRTGHGELTFRVKEKGIARSDLFICSFHFGWQVSGSAHRSASAEVVTNEDKHMHGKSVWLDPWGYHERQ